MDVSVGMQGKDGVEQSGTCVLDQETMRRLGVEVGNMIALQNVEDGQILLVVRCTLGPRLRENTNSPTRLPCIVVSEDDFATLPPTQPHWKAHVVPYHHIPWWTCVSLFPSMRDGCGKRLPLDPVAHQTLLRRVIRNGTIVMLRLTDGRPCRFVCHCRDPRPSPERTLDGWGLVEEYTTVVMRDRPHPCFESTHDHGDVSLQAYSELRGALHAWIHLHAVHRDRTTISRVLLLHGPRGTGKTTLVQRIAAEEKVEIVEVTPSMVGVWAATDPSEGPMSFLRRACRQAPVLLLMDEAEASFPRLLSSDDARVLAILLEGLHALADDEAVAALVVATQPENLASALLKICHDRLLMDLPQPCDRLALFEDAAQHTTLDSDVNLADIAMRCHAFVAADIDSLVRYVAAVAESRGSPCVQMKDFEHVLEGFPSTAATAAGVTRAACVEVPDVSWEDVGGLGTVKAQLEELVLWPMDHPDAFQRLGIRPALAVLLYPVHGPPGTGKTLLARALASRSGRSFLNVSLTDLVKGEVGESEKAIAQTFARGRRCRPSILFFDELQALFGTQEEDRGTRHMISQLGMEMDRAAVLGDMFVLGATNALHDVDPSLLRPGRFDHLVLVPSPDAEGRKEILSIHTRAMPLGPDVSLEILAHMTHGLTGADLKSLCTHAALAAMERGTTPSPHVTQGDFIRALTP